MTIPECAEEFGFPVATVRRLVQDGAFPVMKVGSASYILRETFSQYLASFSFLTSTQAIFTSPVENKNGTTQDKVKERR